MSLNQLGKYQIRRELGKGAMGVVYEGFDPGIERVVAIKTIRRDLVDASELPDTLARFKREAQAAGRLMHPNIVAIYEFGEDGPVSFIAMEYIDGVSLKDLFDDNQRFNLADINRMMAQLLDALAYSHQHGVVHRDIKPANIMIVNDSQIKVADFGIAKIESSNLTQAGTVMGTPSYMSPEQFMGQQVDGRSDLFSAGVILYQWLTGEKPFNAGSVTTIMHKVLREEPLAPSLLNVQTPRPLDAVIRKALAKRPEDRYQTAQAFAAALNHAVQGDTDLVVSTTPLGDADATLAPNTPEVWASTMKIDLAEAATLKQSAEAATLKQAAEAATRVQPAAASSVAQPATAAALAPANAAPTQNVANTAASKSTAPPRPTANPTPQAKSSNVLPWAIAALFGGVMVLGTLGAGAWWWSHRHAAEPSQPEAAPVAIHKAPAAATPTASVEEPAPTAANTDPNAGTMVITAMGMVDPESVRFQQNKELLTADLKEDARRALIAKAIALYVNDQSIRQNYPMVDKLMAQNAQFIASVEQDGEPFLGQDGLMHVVSKARVRVKQVQKALNQMSEDERVDFIRHHGDPKIALEIEVRQEEDNQTRRSAVAENTLKARIQKFGYRTWSDGESGKQSADFVIRGEVSMRKLSGRLPASGLPYTRYAINAWTVKCIDTSTGEEIYINTTMPKAKSATSEEAALTEVGGLVADEFNRDFFLKHFNSKARTVKMVLRGVPNGPVQLQFQNELQALPGVLGLTPAGGFGDVTNYELLLADEGGDLSSLLNNNVLGPLNTKMGQGCFSIMGTKTGQVLVQMETSCSSQPMLDKFMKKPPAALTTAPAQRQEQVIPDPDRLKKMITI